jgi:hypothetical protein
MPRKPTKAEEQDWQRLEAKLNKQLPPGSRHHQYWCAIFRGERCDCDDLPPRPSRRIRGDGGGAAASTAPKRALEDVRSNSRRGRASNDPATTPAATSSATCAVTANSPTPPR